MASHGLQQKAFRPVPPEKGSFPIDRDNVCKVPMLNYMICLKKNDDQSHNCRQLAKDYLGCRMDNNLMTREEFSKLGFSQNASKDHQPS